MNQSLWCISLTPKLLYTQPCCYYSFNLLRVRIIIVSIEGKFFDTKKAIFTIPLTKKTGDPQYPERGEIYLSSDNMWYLREPNLNN